MKKWIVVFIIAAMMLSLSACGNSVQTVAQTSVLDLTAMSSTVMFAELFNMTMEPEKYVGRTVRMQGQLSALPNPVTGQTEYAVLAVDAAACCVQGLDLALEGGEYPELDSEVTIMGTYRKFTDNGMTRYRVADVVWE